MALALPALYAIKLIVKFPTVLKVDVIFETDVDVLGTPPCIVHLTESGKPVEAVEVLVKVRLLPWQTTVSLVVKLAEAVGAIALP